MEKALQSESQTEPPVQSPAEEEQVKWGQVLVDIIETLVLALVLFLGINAVSARPRGRL